MEKKATQEELDKFIEKILKFKPDKEKKKEEPNNKKDTTKDKLKKQSPAE